MARQRPLAGAGQRLLAESRDRRRAGGLRGGSLLGDARSGVPDAALPDGAAFARYEFYKKVAPRMLSVFANTDGAFGTIFDEYARQAEGK